jgi:hypothetical protein
MAGLSIARRRKAWLKGVAYGASGKGKCLYHVDKLQGIFQKGILHGRTNSATPYVRAVVEQEQRRRFPRSAARTIQPKPRRRYPEMRGL